MSARVDVDTVLDGAGFKSLTLIVALCCTSIFVLDGFDLQIIGFAAPALVSDFHIERSALAPVLAASLIGMAVGSFVLGPLGDRFGRRPALLLSTFVFGAATLLATTATTIDQLAIWRLVTGLGLGGALPNATALMAEYAPPKARSLAIAAAVTGVPIGGILGAAIAAEIVPLFGWRSVFLVGGVAPLLALIVIFRVLPESPRYLTTRPKRSGELAAILNRIAGAGAYSAADEFYLGANATTAAVRGVRPLFAAHLMRDTLATWLIFATNIFAVYSFFSWAPVVLTSIGFDLATAVRAALFFNLAGVFGALVGSWALTVLGSRGVLLFLTALGVASLGYLYWLTSATLIDGALRTVELMSAVWVAGFTILSIQIIMYSVAANVYPTASRSSGVGWALGVGRIGGILSAFLGGILLARLNGPAFFLGVAVVLFFTLLGVAALRRHLRAVSAGKAA